LGLGGFIEVICWWEKFGRTRPDKIYRSRASSIRKISICVNPHQRLSALLSGFKKKNYMVGAGSPISLTTTDQSEKPAPKHTQFGFRAGLLRLFVARRNSGEPAPTLHL